MSKRNLKKLPSKSIPDQTVPDDKSSAAAQSGNWRTELEPRSDLTTEPEPCAVVVVAAEEAVDVVVVGFADLAPFAVAAFSS